MMLTLQKLDSSFSLDADDTGVTQEKAFHMSTKKVDGKQASTGHRRELRSKLRIQSIVAL